MTKVGLSHGTSDRQIWDYAAQHGFAIITADKDFLEMAEVMGPPQKIILLENCDYPTNVAVRILTANAIRLSEFERNDRSFLILRRP